MEFSDPLLPVDLDGDSVDSPSILCKCVLNFLSFLCSEVAGEGLGSVISSACLGLLLLLFTSLLRVSKKL